MRKIGIVGTGPSGIYSLLHLLRSQRRLDITMFERGAKAGLGTPYDPDKNDAAMLANIASIELPPVTERLIDWLQARSDTELAQLQLARDDIDERAFYPRVTIGAYYHDQLRKLVSRAESLGHSVTIHTGHLVTDVIVHAHDATVQVCADGVTRTEEFDYVIVASGHQEREDDDALAGIDHAYAKREVESWRDARIGVLGTSLSAIDVAIGAATEAGRFERRDGQLHYVADADDARFAITLMSRRGLLPEADFYCPIPYEPLHHCTAEAVEAICSDARDDKFDRIFDLFKQELTRADPGYADGIGLHFLTPDSFSEVYFAARQRVPALTWARANLTEAKENARHKKTVPWRYAILRMHERFGAALRHFDERDRARFNRGLKNVFIDNYAAVPPLSIERLLAMADAGRLRVATLGGDYSSVVDPASGQTCISGQSFADRFDIMIDARGQPALTLQELPFPTLRLQIIANERARNRTMTDAGEQSFLQAGVAVGDSYELDDGLYSLSRVYCLSIPHLLRLHPFIQGLTSCNELAEAMAASLETVMLADGPNSDDIGLAPVVVEFDRHSLITTFLLQRAA